MKRLIMGFLTGLLIWAGGVLACRAEMPMPQIQLEGKLITSVVPGHSPHERPPYNRRVWLKSVNTDAVIAFYFAVGYDHEGQVIAISEPFMRVDQDGATWKVSIMGSKLNLIDYMRNNERITLRGEEADNAGHEVFGAIFDHFDERIIEVLAGLFGHKA